MKCIAQFSLAALLLLGCAHRSLLQEEADKFVGQPVSAVTAKIGFPTEEHEVGGARLYVWSSATDRGESTQGVCTLRATVRGRDRIIGLGGHRRPVRRLCIDAQGLRLSKRTVGCPDVAPIMRQSEQIAVTASGERIYHHKAQFDAVEGA